MTPLWRKEASHLVVEIRVGNTWVNFGQRNTLSEAKALAGIGLKEPATAAARIVEHEIVHRATQIEYLEKDAITPVPPKMTSLDYKLSCPRCDRETGVATDGTNQWILCTRCQGAFPA